MKECEYWRSRSFLYQIFSRFCMFCALLGQDIRWVFSGQMVLWSLFSIEKPKLPNLPCRKIGQGHSRVIIWTNYDGLESRMLHTKFRGNRPAGSREIFWRGFTIYGRGGHLGHVTSIMSSDFHFLVPESFHTQFGSDRHSSFWENPVWFLYVHNLGPRSGNDLDLQHSHIFIYSIRCLLLLPFRSLAAIVSEKSILFTFANRKA